MTARKNTTARTTRNAKTDEAKLKAKATVIDNDTGEVHESAWTRFAAAQDELFAELGVPSGKRLLASVVVGLITSMSVGWIGGYLSSALLAGVLLLTGSAFLGWIVYLLGVVLALAAGILAGNFVANYVLSAKLDEHVRSAKSWVSGLFKRGGNDADVVAA